MVYTFRNLLGLLESAINARNKCLTAKLLQQGYRYHKLRKTFSKFYRRHCELISKYNVGLKTLLSEGLSEPEFYGDLVYKFKKLKGINDFSFQFRKIITRYRRIGYNLNVMRNSILLYIIACPEIIFVRTWCLQSSYSMVHYKVVDI